MKKRIIVFAIFFLSAVFFLPGAVNSWGLLKKIQFFCTQGNEPEVVRILNGLSGSDLPRQEKRELVNELIRLGDYFANKKKYELAEDFYKQGLFIKPDAWVIFNKLEQVRRANGSLIPNIAAYWKQLKLLVTDFVPAFLLVNGLFIMLFYSGLIVLYLYLLFILWKYSSLLINDFLQQKKREKSIVQWLFIALLLGWPLLLGGGWAVYPFILTAFFWVYMTKPERKLALWTMSLLLFFSFVFGISKWLEMNAAASKFVFEKKVFDGNLRNVSLQKEQENPDMQVFYAYFQYESGQIELAQTLLNSLPVNYQKSVRKDLQGILQYTQGNFEQSLQSFRESLNEDDQNQATQRNLTLALMKSEDQQLYQTYIRRFPQIRILREEIQRQRYEESILQMNFPHSWLWRKVMKIEKGHFPISLFLKEFSGRIFQVPILIYIIVFIFYRMIVKKLFPFLGDSEFCSKCLKIIKRKMIEHHHILCEDCYQLFMMKEPVFFDAKILKEKEINRRVRVKSFVFYTLSLIIPGFSLNFYEKSRSFVFFSWIIFFLAGFSLYLGNLFISYYGAMPLILFVLGIITLLIYLIVSLYSLKGCDNGF